MTDTKKWRRENAEHVREYRRKSYQDNREKELEQNRQYHAENKEQIRERKRKWQLSKNGRYSSYKCAAKTRKIAWDLSKDDFLKRWDQPCHYCGDPITGIGIDRIDSSLGYTEENVVSCCEVCNRMKLAYSTNFFLEHARKITEHNS